MGFGGAPLGDLYTKITDAEAEATLLAAWNAGIRYYDTAPWYGRGQSEHRIGRHLYHRSRRAIIVSTKIGRVLRAPANAATFDRGRWAGGLSFDIRWDYSYDGIMRAYEDSLQRLSMNAIDILIIHSRLLAPQDGAVGLRILRATGDQRLSRPVRIEKAHGLIGPLAPASTSSA